jgi:hypothetical protein
VPGPPAAQAEARRLRRKTFLCSIFRYTVPNNPFTLGFQSTFVRKICPKLGKNSLFQKLPAIFKFALGNGKFRWRVIS